jgi:tRNA (Thr-GGU) A37 N-methylase
MYVKIPFDALDKMPIRDRKYYIHKYNEYMEKRNEAMEGASSGSFQGMDGDDMLGID